MDVKTYEAVLDISEIAGGFPGDIDKMRAFLQVPAMARRVPDNVREEFLQEESKLRSSVNTSESVGLVQHDGSVQVKEAGEAESESIVSVRTGFRVDAEGHYMLAQHQIKAMLQESAEALFPSKGAGKMPGMRQVKNAIKRCLRVSPKLIELEFDGETRQEAIHQIVEHPRYGFPVPVNRIREIIPEATVTFQVRVLQSDVGKRLEGVRLLEMFEHGGEFIGLGTDRGYGFGTFEVVSFDELT